MYLVTAQRLKAQQGKSGEEASADQQTIEQLEFEFVLFSSALIDYDYIMGLIARFSQEKPGKETMSREQIINLLSANSNLMDEREEIIAYINTLEAGKGHGGIEDIRGSYQVSRHKKPGRAQRPGRQGTNWRVTPLQGFVDGILDRMIFDGEQLSDLFEPLDLGWKARGKGRAGANERVGAVPEETGGWARDFWVGGV